MLHLASMPLTLHDANTAMRLISYLYITLVVYLSATYLLYVSRHLICFIITSFFATLLFMKQLQPISLF